MILKTNFSDCLITKSFNLITKGLLRCHSWLRNVCSHFTTDRDGRTVSFNAVSFDEDMPLMIWGYVDLSIGIEHPITKTDFCLETVNDVKQLPELISIRLSTVADEYILDLAVEQVNGSECLWGNNNTIWVNCNKVTAMLTNVTQGFTAKGMGSSHFYRNNYSVSNEDIPNRVVEKCLEFPVATGEDTKADILSFSEVACGDEKLTGGKGSSLALLKSISNDNFNVPGGFCITITGNRKHINAFEHLKIAIDALTKKCSEVKLVDVQDQCERIGKLFEESELSFNLKSKIISCLKEQFGESYQQKKFAVRSSAAGEDGDEISGAGQMETFLGCLGHEMIFRAVKKCWASCFSFKAVEYRRQYGQIIDVGMCVVVQEMVAADIAGVLFTRDPITGNPGVINISANYGLGESVVSASSDPDNIIVNRDPENYLEIKNEGDVKEVETIKINRTECCLTHDQALKLAEICIKIESNYGDPRDIEWAIKENEIYLLQARPITSLDNMSEFELEHEFNTPLLTDKVMFTSGNIREVIPGAVSPLTQSFIMDKLSVGLILLRHVKSKQKGRTYINYRSAIYDVFTWHYQQTAVPTFTVRGGIFDSFLSTLRKLFVPQLTFHPTFVRTNSTWKWSRFLDRIEICYSRNEKNPTVNTKNFNKGFDLAFNGRPIDDSQISEVGLRRYGYRSYFRSCQGAIKMLRIFYCTKFVQIFQICLLLNVSRTEKNLKEMQSLLGNFELNISNYCNLEELWNTVISNTGFLSESVNKHMAITLSSVISNTQIFVELLGADPEFTDKHYADFATLMAIDSSSEHVESADVPLALKVKAFSCLTVIEEIEFFSKFAKSLANEIAQHIEIEKFLSMSDEASSFVIVTRIKHSQIYYKDNKYITQEVYLLITSETRNTLSIEAVNWITLEDSPIAKQFKVFLDKHGHRSSREVKTLLMFFYPNMFDVMFKTWGMDPVQLISPLKACMNQKSQIKLSKKTLDEALAQLKCNLTSTQKKSLENLVPKSRKFVAFREQAKSLMIRTIHQYRKEFWKLAKLMVKEGRLPDPELLMFMTKLEISNLLKTRSSAIIQRAIRRRRLFSKLNDAVYPEIIFGLPESVYDTAVVATSQLELQKMISRIHEMCTKYGMSINIKKTKVMVVRKKKEQHTQGIKITVDGQKLEHVKEYTYLGSVVNENAKCLTEVRKRIGMAKTSFWKCKEFLRRDLALTLKKRLLDCYVKSVAAYGCEAWTFSKEIIARINALQLWCYRRMLKVKYTDHVTNKKVKERIGAEKIQWAEDLARRKLKFAGHVMRGCCDTLTQLVLEGLVEGKRDRGRQRRVWGDDLKEWTRSKNLGEVKRKAENKVEWRIMVHGLRFEDVNLTLGCIAGGRYVYSVAIQILNSTAVSQGTVKGKARVITKVEDAKEIVPGEILVTTATDIAWSPYFPSLSGVVTEIGGLVSHGAVVAREYGIPCVVGVQQVTSILKSGDLIFLDAKKGQVSKLESE
ncbi:putative phosphoenolpyruvate synthase [Nymphon striatum]|nr:putative phosphoenolpyruvate synthase [Nymphon striatum]